MNKVILIGRVTKDVELATTNNGISVCKFTLAVQRKYSNAEGEKDTDFINIETWRTTAENCHKYLKKGSRCAVVGRIQNNSYDAQDGTKRYVTLIVADEVHFLSSPSEKPQEEAPKINLKQRLEQASIDDVQPELQPIDDDSLPF